MINNDKTNTGALKKDQKITYKEKKELFN